MGMNKETYHLDKKTVWVDAVFIRHTGRDNKRLLFRDVQLAGGNPLRDHVNIPLNTAAASTLLVPGQRYRFKAYVYHYERGGYCDTNGQYVPIYWQVGLKYPSKFRKI
jgi:hypothetical protein